MPASPPNSRRARILNNLVRQLQTIKTTDPLNYSRNIYDATTSVKTWAQTPESSTPMIYVIDEDTQIQYHAGTTLEMTWNISLYGVMKGTTQLDMEEFISDIMVCLSANARLSFEDTGPQISHIRIRNIITDSQLFSEIENSQLFKMTVSLIYSPCYGTR